MSVFDLLAIAALLCAWEAHNCSKRARLWDAINEIDQRKLDIEP